DLRQPDVEPDGVHVVGDPCRVDELERPTAVRGGLRPRRSEGQDEGRGGREGDPAAGPAPVLGRAAYQRARNCGAVMGEHGYGVPEVGRIVGISDHELDYWARTGLVRPLVNDAQ